MKNGARVLAFDQHHAVVVVSKPSPNQLFPGFGVVKVSCLFPVLIHTFKEIKYLYNKMKPEINCGKPHLTFEI